MSYIPQQVEAFAVWVAAFAATLVGDPTRYGVTAEEADEVVLQNEEFQARFLVSENPSTRTSVSIAAREEVRDVLTDTVRRIVRIIQANSATTDEMREELGITVPKTATGGPIPVPSEAPIFGTELTGTPLTLKHTYANALTPDSGALPPGVNACQIKRVLTAVGAEPPQFDGVGVSQNISSTPKLLSWPQATGGQLHWFAARWIKNNGQASPWSIPVVLAL